MANGIEDILEKIREARGGMTLEEIKKRIGSEVRGAIKSEIEKEQEEWPFGAPVSGEIGNNRRGWVREDENGNFSAVFFDDKGKMVEGGVEELCAVAMALKFKARGDRG